MEELSGFRLHSKQIEIISGDLVAGNVGGIVAPAQRATGVGVDRNHPAEGGVTLAKIFECRIGRCEQVADGPTPVPKLIETLRIAYERAQQDRIQHAKDDN